MNFGSLTPPDDAHAIMDRAHELGINFFDTANSYGSAHVAAGQVADNEQRTPAGPRRSSATGSRAGGGRREKTVLATKLYGDMGELAERGQAVGAQHPPRAATPR